MSDGSKPNPNTARAMLLLGLMAATPGCTGATALYAAPYIDDDNDGYEAGYDCDDTDPDRHPGAGEIADGVDQDCDWEVDEGTDVYDDDHDGWSEDAGDCDDSDSYTFPGAPELPDGLDDDCDGTVDEDYVPTETSCGVGACSATGATFCIDG